MRATAEVQSRGFYVSRGGDPEQRNIKKYGCSEQEKGKKERGDDNTGTRGAGRLM